MVSYVVSVCSGFGEGRSRRVVCQCRVFVAREEEKVEGECLVQWRGGGGGELAGGMGDSYIFFGRWYLFLEFFVGLLGSHQTVLPVRYLYRLLTSGTSAEGGKAVLGNLPSHPPRQDFCILLVSAFDCWILPTRIEDPSRSSSTRSGSECVV